MGEYRYNGKELVDEIGLYDYGARWYDPAVARWGQVDPMAEAMPGLTPYRFGFNNPISFADPSGLFEQNGGGDDPDKREIRYDENGKPIGVRLGCSDSSTGATSYPLVAVGGASSGIGTLMQQRANYNYSGGTLPQVSVNATAPDHLWKVNGDYMTQDDAFAMARRDLRMASRLLQEEFGTSTAIKFMAYDVNSAIYDFANNYVNPLLSNFGPVPTIALAKYGGLALVGSGFLWVSKKSIGMRVGFGGSKTTLAYSAAIYNCRELRGIGNSLGSKTGWTPYELIGKKANQHATYYGRWLSAGAIVGGGTAAGAGFYFDR